MVKDGTKQQFSAPAPNPAVSKAIRLSVILPTLNAAPTLSAALDALRRAPGAEQMIGEVIVADGGSVDETLGIARRAGAKVISAPRGRGAQLAAGAEHVHGNWLLFLHADTQLAPNWAKEARNFIQNPERRFKQAAVFRFALDADSFKARLAMRLVGWRNRLFALPYGDQGLLIRRSFYQALGGFRPLPLMEDVDLIRKITRRRLAFLQTPARTSAAKYRRDGWWRRSFRNMLCVLLYFLGAPMSLLARLYR